MLAQAFEVMMSAIATVAGGQAALAQGYTSSIEWKEKMRKHTRIECVTPPPRSLLSALSPP